MEPAGDRLDDAAVVYGIFQLNAPPQWSQPETGWMTNSKTVDLYVNT